MFPITYHRYLSCEDLLGTEQWFLWQQSEADLLHFKLCFFHQVSSMWMKIHAVADFMCSKYELLNNVDSSLFTLKLNSLRFYGFIFVPGHESQRQPAVEACIAELHCSCTVLCSCVRLSVFLFQNVELLCIILSKMPCLELSRVSLYFSINHF